MARFLLPLQKSIGMSPATAIKFGPALFFLLLTIGRIVGSAVLTLLSPHTFFRISAFLGLAGTALLMVGTTPLAIAGVIAGGLGFANIWPLLFSITVEEKPESANELSGLMCMAISGGALVPLLMSKLVDSNLTHISFIVPAVCFLYLFLLSLKGAKKTIATAKA
jgi:fucose permease